MARIIRNSQKGWDGEAGTPVSPETDNLETGEQPGVPSRPATVTCRTRHCSWGRARGCEQLAANDASSKLSSRILSHTTWEAIFIQKSCRVAESFTTPSAIKHSVLLFGFFFFSKKGSGSMAFK